MSREALPADADPDKDTHFRFDLCFDNAVFGAPVNRCRPPGAPQPFLIDSNAAEAVLLLKLIKSVRQ